MAKKTRPQASVKVPPQAEIVAQYAPLYAGDPIPWLTPRASNNPHFLLSSLGGRYVVLCFYATAADPVAADALKAVERNRALFDDDNMCFFGVSVDPADEKTGRVSESLPGLRYFWDFDGAMSRAFGVLPHNDPDSRALRRVWIVLDPSLRIMATFPLRQDGGNLEEIFAYLRALPQPFLARGIEIQAPVLYLPNVFEPEFCRELIALHKASGGQETGFMREVDGKTVIINDKSHKIRRDHVVEDDKTVGGTQLRVRRRIVPEIQRAFNFEVTRMERYLIGCYTSEDGGHFQPHRDNTTKGTAHRRFAVTINLNDDFDGGRLCFPEYGPRSFKPPVGGAVVFSCSLMHMVTPVTRGERYAFLPFLYDEAAVKVRIENNAHLADESLTYQTNTPAQM